MTDREVLPNPEEQYPLLKVDAGGDMGNPQQKQTPQTTAWGISFPKKQSWFSRWPEFISACWMTLILFGISFLVFYALGMAAYRRQQFIVIKCNNTKPASNVFYHQIVKRGGQIYFDQYSDFLAEMAVHYPLLRHNVIFLIDDSYYSYTRVDKHSKLFNRFISYNPYRIEDFKLDKENKLAMCMFQRKYQNVNVTIMSLSRYMATTPLRYKWKLLSHTILPLYFRVFSVFENAGIAMDLVKFNNNHYNRLPLDRKIAAILKQHNDGINIDEYAKALNKIGKLDQDNDLVSLLYGMFTNVLNQTRSFINRTIYTPTSTDANLYLPLVHRTKRDDLVDSINENILSLANVNSTNGKPVLLNNDTLNNQTEKLSTLETLKQANFFQDVNESNYGVNIKLPKKSNDSEQRQVVMVYDMFIVSDVGPPYVLSDSLIAPEIGSILNADFFKPLKPVVRNDNQVLALDEEGSFIAASTKRHPFLGNLISAASLRMPLKFVIQDAFFTQCSELLKNNAYCNNIFIL